MSGSPSDEGMHSVSGHPWLSQNISDTQDAGSDPSVCISKSDLNSNLIASHHVKIECPEKKENAGLPEIVGYNIGVDPSNQALDLEPAYSEKSVASLASAYLDSIKHLVSFTTNVNIVIRPIESSPSVEVNWDLLRDVNPTNSDNSGRSHQVYIPEEVRSGGARYCQLFVLGNILLEICESETGKVEGLELYEKLENGRVSEKIKLVAHWPFICSCLSFKFAKRAFVQDQAPHTESGLAVQDQVQAPHIESGQAVQDQESKSTLRNVAVGGTAIAAACLGAPFILAAAGFGASGIIGGSLAAYWQSSTGAVAGGSAFALLQSTAATGCVGLQTAGAVSGAVAAATAAIRAIPAAAGESADAAGETVPASGENAAASGESQDVSNLPSIPYQYLYESDLNDLCKLEKLVACKEVDVLDSDEEAK